MHLLWLKIAVVPLLTAFASLAARRWGQAVAGWIAALPLISGPVIVLLALERGNDFAAEAAIGILVGLVPLSVASVAYTHVARVLPAAAALPAAWAVFVLAAWLLRGVELGLVAAFLLVVAALSLALWLIPSSNEPAHADHPLWEIPLRMLVAGLMVVTITAVAARLGPHLTGLLSPLPVVSGVIALFGHRRYGPIAVRQMFRGVMLGSYTFAVFFLVTAALLARTSLLATLLYAALAAAGVHALVLWGMMQQRNVPELS